MRRCRTFVQITPGIPRARSSASSQRALKYYPRHLRRFLGRTRDEERLDDRLTVDPSRNCGRFYRDTEWLLRIVRR